MSARPSLKKRASDDEGGAYFLAPSSSLEFIRTGSRLLDCVLGGGWPLGRISNVVGDKSTGKTLLAIEACANFARQHPDGKIWYNEAEAAFDKDYAAALGLPLDRIHLTEDCNTVEDFFEDLDSRLARMRGKGRGLYVLDSLDALSDRDEMKRKIDEGSYGAAKAKKLSELFRRKVRELRNHNVHVLVISQTRDAIGVMFGEKHTRSGGKALDFYASQVLYLAQKGAIEKTHDKVKRRIGVTIKARCKKNKVGLPGRECEFNILFGYGVDDLAANIAWLDAVGMGKKVEELKRELARADREKEKAVRAAIDDLVVNRWYEIEKSFLPTRRKYP